MRKAKYSFSIVDFLVGLAVLMILAALFAPHFVAPTNKAKAAAPAAQVQPTRPSR